MSNAPAQPKVKPKHNPRRTAILLGILGVGIVMLAYDFYVARPACDAGMEKMHKLLEKSMTAGANESRIDPATVQKELGFAPSVIEKNQDRYLIETYKWRGGLPFRSYNIYVVYRGIDKPSLQNATQNQYPDEDVIPPRTIKAQPAPNQGQLPTAATTPPEPTATEPVVGGAGDEKSTPSDKPSDAAQPTDEAKPNDSAKAKDEAPPSDDAKQQ